jgi:hypothetical protein
LSFLSTQCFVVKAKEVFISRLSPEDIANGLATPRIYAFESHSHHRSEQTLLYGLAMKYVHVAELVDDFGDVSFIKENISNQAICEELFDKYWSCEISENLINLNGYLSPSLAKVSLKPTGNSKIDEWLGISIASNE